MSGSNNSQEEKEYKGYREWPGGRVLRGWLREASLRRWYLGRNLRDKREQSRLLSMAGMLWA